MKFVEYITGITIENREPACYKHTEYFTVMMIINKPVYNLRVFGITQS
jgi:hypothetical protein